MNETDAKLGKKDYLQVVGAGFGRTGTMSLRKALQTLGYRTHHMMALREHPGALSDWEQVTLQQAKGEDTNELLAKIFADYDAQVDFPGASFFEELMQDNPNAKVILTLHPRGAEGWYESSIETIAKTEGAWWGYLTKTSLFDARTNRFQRWTSYLIWQGTLKGKMHTDKQGALEEYQKRIDFAKRIVRPENLLVFSPTDGWEPLCKFLAKAVPDTPYPRVNEREEMIKFIANYEKLGQSTLLKYLGILAGGTLGVSYFAQIDLVWAFLLCFITFAAVFYAFCQPGPIPFYRPK